MGRGNHTHLNDFLLQSKAMGTINGVPPRTNMHTFYIERNILIVKHSKKYKNGLIMNEYLRNMTSDVFNYFFSNVSDIHQRGYLNQCWLITNEVLRIRLRTISLCKLILVINGRGISYEISCGWIPLKFTNFKSTLVHVKALCHQARSHYPSQ